MAKAKDPVCGREIDTETATERTSIAGETYFFCSADDRRKFEANPQAYDVELERHEAPYTKAKGFVAPKFGSAGSGGLEYERLPERHDDEEDAERP